MDRLLSVVIPVYNEQESLKDLYEGISVNVKQMKDGLVIRDYEIWFISDGSTDASEDIIKSLIEQDERVHLIVFRKNFGKARALQAGFRHANGDIVITMDADLQDDANEFINFIEKIDEGYDLVSGWKFNRLDPLEKRVPSRIFNKVTSLLSGIKLHDFNCGFKAYRKAVVESLDIYGEMHRYVPVLANRKGFRIAEIKVLHHKREHGKSKYGLERYLRGLFDSMTTSFLIRFYDRPMYFFGKIGLSLLLIGVLICLWLFGQWCLDIKIGGRPLLMLGVLFIILGVQSISTGFIGDMIVDATYRNRYEESYIKEII